MTVLNGITFEDLGGGYYKDSSASFGEPTLKLRVGKVTKNKNGTYSGSIALTKEQDVVSDGKTTRKAMTFVGQLTLTTDFSATDANQAAGIISDAFGIAGFTDDWLNGKQSLA